MLKGIDVSEHNGNIDWENTNIDFAILRLGWIGNSRNEKDKYFDKNYCECKRLKIPIGVYVYNYVKTPQRASECANWVLEQLEDKDLELPIYIDMEDASLVGLGKKTLTEICNSFNNTVETKFWAGVYANLNWFNNYLLKDEIKQKYTTWIAHYGASENKYKGEYDMLQYTSDGTVSGIKGRVDLNIMYRDLITEIDECRNTNKKKMDFLGITKFHQYGYKGSGITIASRETRTAKHGSMVADILEQIAPEACFLYNENYQNGTDADIYTTSLFSLSDKFERHQKTSQSLYDKGVFLCCAVGNDGETRQTFLSTLPCWTSIGAYDLVDGKPKKMYYSSVTEDIDFCSFTNMATEKGNFNGTSCATPVFAAMCALAQQFFKLNLGRKLTNKELLRFIKDNCIDLFDEGHDDRSGWGLFVLPDPEKIDVNKYVINDEGDFDNGEIRI